MSENIQKISALVLLSFLWLAAMIFTSPLTAAAAPADPEKPVPEPYGGSSLPDDMAALSLSENNAAFIRYINVILSNYGEEQDKEEFHKVIDLHLLSQQYYLRREFLQQYREIRKAHKILDTLLQSLVEKNYRQYSLSLLNETNVLVSLANDPRAAAFLKDGYYAYQRAEEFYTRAYYTNKFQYSQKIKYYIEAAEQFRLANRLAVRSIIEAKTPIAVKRAYKTQRSGDFTRHREFPQETSFEATRLALISLFKRPMLAQDDSFKLLQRHRDNFGLFFNEKKSEYLLYLSTRSASLDFKEKQ